MKKLLYAFLVMVLVLNSVSFAIAERDLFAITGVRIEDSSEDYWKIYFSIRNDTGNVVHNLELTVCCIDQSENIIFTNNPSAEVRLKPDKAIVLNVLIEKKLNPYAVYVDKISYKDNNDEYHQTYLDNTEEFQIDMITSVAPKTTESPASTQVSFSTPVPIASTGLSPTPNPNVPMDYEVVFGRNNRNGKYTGQTVNGLPNGEGSFVADDSMPTLRYDGTWTAGKPSGKGYLKDEGYQIRFVLGERGEYDRVGVFEGETIDGVASGKGTFTVVNDDNTKMTYSGSFAAGTLNGYGEMSFDSEKGMVIRGTFVHGEYKPKVSELVGTISEIIGTSFNQTIQFYDESTNFIKNHENIFTEETDIDPEWINKAWSISDFKKMPQEQCDKLVLLNNASVIEANDIEMASLLMLQDESGTLYVTIHMVNNVYSINDLIDEAYILPLEWLNIENGYVFCLMAYPGSHIKTEPASELSKTTELEETQVETDQSIQITNDVLSVAVGKKLKLNAEIKTQIVSVPAKSIVVWTSSDTSIAKVDSNGNVAGAKPGKAVITCSIKEKPEIKASVTVTVIRPVTGIKLSEKTLTIAKGQSATVSVIITPKDATNQKVRWESSAVSVAKATQDGKIIANGGGDCTITCTTEDGAKTASVKVHVPTFSFNKTEYTVTSKKGLTIPVNWDTPGITLTLTDNGGSFFDANWTEDSKIQIVPNKAGKGTIVVNNKATPRDKIKISITIDHNAVYDNQSYPVIKYDNAMRYPNRYKGDKVSFSGKVLQVMSGKSTTTYRISSKGRYDNAVYVTIDNNDILTPVIEDDTVTVYGTYNGNETYTAIWGNAITIPHVKAERIVVK